MPLGEVARTRAQDADVAEQVEVSQPDVIRLRAAHRKPGDRAMLAVGLHAIRGFDQRQHIGEQVLLEQRRVFLPAFFPRDGTWQCMAERHGDDHRLDLALGEQVVHDQVRLAHHRPTPGDVARAVEQVEYGVGRVGILRVVRRRVDVDIAHVAECPRGVVVAVQRPVRHVARVEVIVTRLVRDDE